MMFTSPSSAQGNLDAEPIALDPERPPKRKLTASKRPDVTTELGMGGQVTARAIAYTAVQVCLYINTLPSLHHYSSSTSHSMMPKSGAAITTVSTMRNSTSSLSTFLKRTKPRRERLPPKNFSTGGISTSQFKSCNSLLIPAQTCVSTLARYERSLISICEADVARGSASTTPSTPPSCLVSFTFGVVNRVYPSQY